MQERGPSPSFSVMPCPVSVLLFSNGLSSPASHVCGGICAHTKQFALSWRDCRHSSVPHVRKPQGTPAQNSTVVCSSVASVISADGQQIRGPKDCRWRRHLPWVAGLSPTTDNRSEGLTYLGHFQWSSRAHRSRVVRRGSNPNSGG